MNLEMIVMVHVIFAWIVAPALVHMVVALYHLFTGGSDNE